MQSPCSGPNVGRQYLDLFTRVASINAGMERLVPQKPSPVPGDGLEFAELAKEGRMTTVHTIAIVLDHLDRMTDSTGLDPTCHFQPSPAGERLHDRRQRPGLAALRSSLESASRRADVEAGDQLPELPRIARGIGRGFHNFLSYDRRWLDAEGCGDCQGQAVRALAEVLGSNLPDGYRALARELIDAVLPTLADLRSLRAQSYVILAYGHLWSMGVEDIEPLETVAWSAARRLAECYHRAVRPDWQWFESRMTYANAVLPHALFVAAQRWPQEDFLDIARASFAFLDQKTTAATQSTGCPVFWPVGNEGWHPRGEEKAPYDQQPVEAVTMAEAAQAALELLGGEEYLAGFRRAHGWFHGRNSLKQPLVDVQSGACYDGLQASGVNRNQGAESTLAWLWTEMSRTEIANLYGDNPEAARVSAHLSGAVNGQKSAEMQPIIPPQSRRARWQSHQRP